MDHVRLLLGEAIIDGYAIGHDAWIRHVLPSGATLAPAPAVTPQQRSSPRRAGGSPRPQVAGHGANPSPQPHRGEDELTTARSIPRSHGVRLAPLSQRKGEGSSWAPPTTVVGERGSRALAAKHSCVALKQDVSFWTNRMRLLRAEVQRQQAKQERSSTLRERTELSTFVNMSLKEQLEEERVRHEAMLEERIDVIRQKKAEHQTALRSALKRTFEEKVERSHMSKLQGTNHARIIHNTKYEKLVQNIQRKEKVQQEKILGLLKRVKDKARQEEEIHSTFETKVQHALENEREYKAQVGGLVKQSADLVRRLRKFQEDGQLETDKIEAIRATAMLSAQHQARETASLASGMSSVRSKNM